MAKHCPACRNEVPADAVDCPHCPHSFRTEDPYFEKHRSRHVPGWAKLIVLLGALGAGGYWAWQTLDFIMTHADNPESQFSMKDIGLGRSAAGRAQPPAGLREEGPRQGGPNTEEPRVSYRLDGEPDTRPDGGGSAPEPDDKPVKSWRFRGGVYDLDSLTPVRDASLTFFDVETQKNYRTVTDGQGRYRVMIPSLQGRGYNVKIERRGYASDYLNPGMENVGRMPRSERLELCGELAHSMNGPYEVRPSGAEALVTNFFIAPLKD